MYLGDNDKIKLNREEGDLEYLIDAYADLEGAIAEGKDSSEIKEEICDLVCSDLSCTNIECKVCPFKIPEILTLKNII